MAYTEVLAGIADGEGCLVLPIVGHDAGDGKAHTIVISDCGLEEGNGTCCFLVGKPAGEADAGMVIDTHMNIFPTNTPTIRLDLAVPADAVAYPVETHQHRNVQMDHLAQMFAQVAPHRLGWFELRKP